MLMTPVKRGEIPSNLQVFFFAFSQLPDNFRISDKQGSDTDSVSYTHLLQENKVKIKEITPMVTLPAKRSYFIMEKVADRLLVIAYDTKGNTYAMLYDEKGNLQKELKTQQKILFDEFTWQNDGYIHYFADGKLYRLDTNTMKLSNVCPYDTIKLDNVSVDDVYYRCLLYTSLHGRIR